jgi:hypothetical protein
LFLRDEGLKANFKHHYPPDFADGNGLVQNCRLPP